MTSKRQHGTPTFLIIWVIFIVPMYLYEGWVIQKLYGWFIVPQFHIPQIGIGTAIGVSALASVLTHQHVSLDDEKDPIARFGAAFGFALMLITMGLIVGAVAHYA